MKERNKKIMNVCNLTKEDFQKVPDRKWDEVITCNSFVIIPTGELHDSGFQCMEIVALDDKHNPMCKCSGCSDVVNLDGIGGYGKSLEFYNLGHIPLNKLVGWSLDVLPCGYVRIFCKGHITIGPALSGLEVYCVHDNEEEK